VRSLIYTNPLGQSVTFYHGPYVMSSLEGVDMPDVNEQEQKAPYQDGTTYLDSLFSPRTIVAKGAIIDIHALGPIFTARQTLVSVLNPKNGQGVLTYANDNATYTAICTAKVTLPNKPANEPTQKFMVEFYCNDPYLYSSVQSSILMALVTGGFTFPFTFPKTFGTYVGNVATPAPNTGDSVTPVSIAITGPCTNPVITNTTTGELIKCNITLNPGDVLTINTKQGSKSIVLNAASGGLSNQMGTLDPTSTFWQLAIGNNQILFSDDNPNGAESCTVTWFNRFSGT